MKKILLVMAMLVMFASSLLAGENGDSLYAKDMLKPGTEAPDFILQNPYGKAVKLSKFRGQYVILEFWASWCPDCRKIYHSLDSIEIAGNPSRAVAIHVSFDDNKESWLNYIKENFKRNTSFSIHVSELKKWKETEISKLYNIKWIPAMYLIDPQGKIVLATVEVNKLAEAVKSLPMVDHKSLESPMDYLCGKMPDFRGGQNMLDKYLSIHVKYPKFCHNKGAEGQIVFSFIVEKNGSISNIDIMQANMANKNLSKEDLAKCENLFKEEAMRVIKAMPAWTPGTQYGIPVRVRYALPITFRLRK